MKNLSVLTLGLLCGISTAWAIPQDFGTTRIASVEDRILTSPDFAVAAQDLPWKDLGNGRFRLQQTNLTVFGLAAESMEMIKEEGVVARFEISYKAKKEPDGQPTRNRLLEAVGAYTGRSPRKTISKEDAFDYSDKAVLIGPAGGGMLRLTIVPAR